RLLEGDLEAHLGGFPGNAAALLLRIGTVDLDLEVAAALVLDPETVEAVAARVLQHVRGGRAAGEVAEDDLVVLRVIVDPARGTAAQSDGRSEDDEHAGTP